MLFIAILWGFLLGQAEAETGALCATPRNAIATLLDNLQPDEWNPEKASTCFGEEDSKDAAKLGIQLKQVLDAQGVFIYYDKIPEDGNYVNEYGANTVILSQKIEGIYLVKQGTEWVFSKESRKEIPKLYSDTFSSWIQHFLHKMPPFAFNQVLGIYMWQFAFFGLLLLVAVIVGRIVNHLIVYQITEYAEDAKIKINKELLQGTRLPLLGIAVGIVLNAGIPDLQLPIRPSQGLHLIATAILSISLVLLLSRLIDTASTILGTRAKQTESKLDDQVIPLASRAAKLVTWLFGIMFILQNLGVQVTALVAFGSVGGVAVALASKDTVENLFGSIMVFVDQPFQIGDWIIIDNSIEGVVEEVGFRSTRVRSFKNSLISVPNAKIAHCTVDNFGKREYRRFKTTIGLRYDTPRAKVEEYIHRVRAYLDQNPTIWSDGIYIYFRDLGAHSLDIMVYTFFQVPDWRAELAAREACLLEFMRIAEEVGVGFAFPTTTIELERQIADPS
jgi:MscS family membrane protein